MERRGHAITLVFLTLGLPAHELLFLTISIQIGSATLLPFYQHKTIK